MPLPLIYGLFYATEVNWTVYSGEIIRAEAAGV